MGVSKSGRGRAEQEILLTRSRDAVLYELLVEGRREFVVVPLDLTELLLVTIKQAKAVVLPCGSCIFPVA